MQSDRQTEVANIKSSWNQGGYAESWGLCILDNVRFQSKKVSLIGNNKLFTQEEHFLDTFQPNYQQGNSLQHHSNFHFYFLQHQLLIVLSQSKLLE